MLADIDLGGGDQQWTFGHISVVVKLLGSMKQRRCTLFQICLTTITKSISHFHLKLTSTALNNAASLVNQPQIEEVPSSSPTHSVKGVCSRVMFVFSGPVLSCPVLSQSCYMKTFLLIKSHMQSTADLFIRQDKKRQSFSHPKGNFLVPDWYENVQKTIEKAVTTLVRVTDQDQLKHNKR